MKIEIREMVYKKFDGHCAYCGDEIEYKDMQVDHIIPQYLFHQRIQLKMEIPFFLNHLEIEDVNHIDNLFPACRICNKKKDTFSLNGFRSELEKQVLRGIKSSSNMRFALKYGLIKITDNPVVFYFEKLKK